MNPLFGHSTNGLLQGRYKMIHEIAKGSFGEVWQAEDVTCSRMVAIKLLSLKEGGDSYLDLFKHEFEILCGLSHRHLARVFDFGYSPQVGRYFFTSEFCPGETLLRAVEKQPLPHVYFEKCLVQILTALDYIHSQGVIHFDLKMENVLVENTADQPHVKLVDFGVAEKVHGVPQRTWMGGTAAYTAPEVLTTPHHVDHRADLYALGMMCLRVLTGKFPFSGPKTDEMRAWHLRGKLSDRIWGKTIVPPYLREITEKLLQKRPSDRFSSARVVLNFLNLATGRKYAAAEDTLVAETSGQGPLIERKELLEDLTSRFRKACVARPSSPKSCLLTLVGESGIGKSRVLDEMRRVIELHEVPLLEITCHREIAAWPAFARFIGIHDDEALNNESGKDGHHDEEFASEESRRRHDMALIVEAIRRKPLCLLLDDAHKVDAHMQSILTELRRHQDLPFFILIARTETPQAGEISLPRLTRNGVFDFARQMLGNRDGIEELSRIVFRFSGGLPLLVEEGIRELAPRLHRGETLKGLPSTSKIQSLYQRRLLALSPPTRELVNVLSLLFRPSDEDEMKAILGVSHTIFNKLLSKAKNSGLIEGDKSGSCQITSQAMAQAVILSLDDENRQRLHRKIAYGLVGLHRSPLKELAYHFAKSGDVLYACQLYQSAAAQLKHTGQVAAGVECLQKAIALLEEGSHHCEDLTLELSRYYCLAGDHENADRCLKHLTNSVSTQYYELRGWVAFKERRLDEARDYYWKALRGLPSNEVVRSISLKNSLGQVELCRGELEAAEAYFQDTLGLEKCLSPDDRSCISNNSLGLVYAARGQIEAGVEFYQKRLQQLSDHHAFAEMNGSSEVGSILIQGGRYRDSIPYLERAYQLADRIGSTDQMLAILSNLTQALLKENRYSDCVLLFRRMLDMEECSASQRDIAFYLLRLGEVSLRLGMSERARDCFERGIQHAGNMKDGALLGWHNLFIGYWEREYGSHDKMRNAFDTALHYARVVHHSPLEAWTLCALAELEHEEGHPQACQHILSELSTIPLHHQDEELRLRVQLLTTRQQLQIEPASSADASFATLESLCLGNRHEEILWQVYLYWGEYARAQGENKTALNLLQKGIKVSLDIALTLSEEYRDRFLRQPLRRKLHDQFAEISRDSGAMGWFLRLVGHVGKLRRTHHETRSIALY